MIRNKSQTGNMIQVVENLPRKCKALSSRAEGRERRRKEEFCSI
jgi:hypothetical protein